MKKYKPSEGVGESKGEFKVSWMIDEELKLKEEITGKLALSMCPGKNLK